MLGLQKVTHLVPGLLACALTALACGEGGAASTGKGGEGGGGASSSSAGGDAAGGSSGTATCGALPDRITLTNVAVDVDILYAQTGYGGVPADKRIAYAIQPNGQAQVAWMGMDEKIHVTPLDVSGKRRGADVLVDGLEVGGLVAHDDGFAVFTRRLDPSGGALAFDANETPAAAHVVRVKDGAESWTSILTGPDGLDGERDYSNGLVGRLAWNGTKYGAYFVIRGGQKHWAAGHYGDKLVYINDMGASVKGGWGWGCSHNYGIRLVPEPQGPFTTLCFSDVFPNPGLNFNTEGKTGRWLAREETWMGFVAGEFGSVVKLADGTYMVGWLSKGEGPPKPDDGSGHTFYEHEREIPDIALLHLDAAGAPMGDRVWLTNTATQAEQSLHLAAHGNSVLVTYRRLQGAACKDKCVGTSEGVFAQLIDGTGKAMGGAVKINAQLSQEDEIAVHADGDLGWAFVPGELDYAKTLDVKSLPPLRTLTIARMNRCE